MHYFVRIFPAFLFFVLLSNLTQVLSSPQILLNSHHHQPFGNKHEPHPQPHTNGYKTCPYGEILNKHGDCKKLKVIENLYVFDAPPLPYKKAPPPKIPEPKINKNVIIVNTPIAKKEKKPLVVHPDQQKTVVYVLTKKHKTPQQVIEFADSPSYSPEVYYIHFEEGENPLLPDGKTLQEALASANIGAIHGGYTDHHEEHQSQSYKHQEPHVEHVAEYVSDIHHQTLDAAYGHRGNVDD